MDGVESNALIVWHVSCSILAVSQKMWGLDSRTGKTEKETIQQVGRRKGQEL